MLAARLVWLQVWKHDELSTQAEANRIAVVPIVPNRGLILDRNGVVLATNYSAYTLEITPSKLHASTDAVIDELAQVVDIQQRDRRRFKRLLDESKSFESLPIRTKLTDEEVARFMAQRYRFPGVEVQARLFRHYPLGETGAHLIGYIGRINQTEKKQIEDWDEDRQANYSGTEYIGKLGLEQAYEDDLHGITGFEEVETSAGGRAVRRLNSHGATPGNTLLLSIDIKLQALVEEMFGERRGALVAIDPRNGEVLALVSKPTLRPQPVRRRHRRRELARAERIDRQAAAEPGAARHLSAGLDLQAVHGDGGAEHRQARPEHGDPRRRHVPVRQPRVPQPRRQGARAGGHDRSIVKSSNVYYYSLANEMGVDLMHEQLLPFGFGRKTGIDIDGEVTGVLPSTAWKTQRLPQARAAEVVRRRDHLAGHRPGLQQLHRCCSWRSATATLVVGRPALQAAPGARDRGRASRASASASPATRWSRCRSSPSTWS